MITSQSGKPTTKGSSEHKSSQGKGQKRPDGQSEKRKDPSLNSLLSTLPMTDIIRHLPDFKWPPPMRAGPDQRNRSLQCQYHRDHGHETNQCQSLKFMIEKLIRAGHLRWYLREPTGGATAAPATDGAVVDIEHASGP